MCLSCTGGPTVEGVPAHAVRGPRAVRAPVPAPGHGAGGHHHRHDVRVHAQAPRQALPLPHRRPIRLSRHHYLYYHTIFIRNVPLFAVIVNYYIYY